MKKTKNSLDDFKLYTISDDLQVNPQFKALKHAQLDTLTAKEKKNFMAELWDIESMTSAVVQIGTPIPEDEIIRDYLKSIHHDLETIRSLIGSGMNFSALLGENAQENEFPEIMTFLHSLPVVQDLIERTLAQKKVYHTKISKTAFYYAIANRTHNLLKKYGLKRTLSNQGLWAKSIMHIANDMGLPLKDDVKKYMRETQKFK